MTGTVWRLAWCLAFRRRRLLAWNVLVPLLLLVPVVTSAAAAAHRAVVVAVFVTFFGTYGSCIPLLRDGMSGWTEKVLLTGYGERRWLIERTLASVSIDFVELVPANVLLVLLVGGPITVGLPAVLAATALALLFANLLGTLVAAGVRSLGEAALGCAVASLFALHFSGVFRASAPGSAGAVLETVSPLRPLHDVWFDLLAGAPAAAAAPVDALLPILTTTLVFAALLLVPVGRRIAETPD